MADKVIEATEGYPKSIGGIHRTRHMGHHTKVGDSDRLVTQEEGRSVVLPSEQGACKDG